MAGMSFSAAEFIAKLREDHFASTPLTATGLVTISEDDDSALLFAYGTDCSNWIKVPVQMIDSVQFLRVIPCKDHNHPLVTLIFRSPQSSEAQTLAALARLATITASNSQASRGAEVLGVPVSGHASQQHAFIAQHHAVIAQHHSLMAQHHSLMATLNVANTVAPDANGKCPDGYSKVHFGLGCYPGFTL